MMRSGLLLAAVLYLAATAANAGGYTADPSASRLDFLGVQAGADFKGTFHQFTAAVDFLPESLGTSHLDVQIDLNSLDTMDKDRDKTMRGPDIFDIAHFPAAHYVTRVITKSAAGYTAVGSLTLHGVTKEVPIDFQFATAAGGAKLEGTAKLKRLEFGVGQGDWKSTEWIKDDVKVTFSLVLKPRP